MKAFKNTQTGYSQLDFPLEKYGYSLENVLNNENRHNIKLVCSIRRHKHKGLFVSTSYARHNDYLKLVETTTYLKCNNRLSPEIAKLYPHDNTVVCRYIGEFMPDYLMHNPDCVAIALGAIFNYMNDVNCINRRAEKFVIPSIVKVSLALSKEFGSNFEFLPKSRIILPELKKEGVKFIYGCGVEDPHIWNFRIVNHSEKTKALTTDFDYFLDKVNYFWELGYFYATFRWLKKISHSLVYKTEKFLLSLVKERDLKAEFMFWLGALSSYCGYRDSLRNIMANGGVSKLKEQLRTIQHLDEKIFLLANKLI